MIQEQYVTFETAKLLQEKDFNEPTLFSYYDNNGIVHMHKTNKILQIIAPIKRPTQQKTVEWLRIKHKLFISITYHNKQYKATIIDIHDANNPIIHEGIICDNPYATTENAIQLCLKKLI